MLPLDGMSDGHEKTYRLTEEGIIDMMLLCPDIRLYAQAFKERIISYTSFVCLALDEFYYRYFDLIKARREIHLN